MLGLALGVILLSTDMYGCARLPCLGMKSNSWRRIVAVMESRLRS